MGFFGGGDRTFKIETVDDIVKALRGEPGPVGAPGPAGADGISPSVEEVAAKVLEQIKLPKDGADGLPGRDGRDAEPVDIEKLKADILKEIPVPKDGKPGAPGQDGIGIQGPPGRDGVSPSIKEIVEAVLPLIPKPKDGVDGTPGLDGRDAPTLEEIVEAVKPLIPEVKDGRDGLDAPFSKWVEINEIDSKESTLFTSSIPNKGKTVIELLLIGEGLSINASFIARKQYVVDNERKTINEFNITPTQRSHDLLAVFLNLSMDKFSIVTTSGDIEMQWKGEVKTYRL